MGVVRLITFLALLALASATYSSISYAPATYTASYATPTLYSYGQQYATSQPYYSTGYYGNQGAYNYGSYGQSTPLVYYPVANPTPGFGTIANDLAYQNSLYGGNGFGNDGILGDDNGLLLFGGLGLLLILLSRNNNG